MCGITGVYLFKDDKRHFSDLTKALEALLRRGPDSEGIYTNKNISLGHRRLSVTDLSSAALQPMSDASGRYTIVLNGEIFNHHHIRRELESKGAAFRSHSDTEVLLQLYIREGIACLEKLNGFFAFAVYDAETEEMFLVRDRFGIKPILWYADDEKLIFASEMKALLAYDFPREVDEVSLAQFFKFNYIPHPYSCFKGVKKLAPGSYLKISPKGTIAEHRYYRVPYRETEIDRYAGSYDEAKEQLEKLLEDSVKLRLAADVPLGVFLSGGIDSSAVAALTSRHAPHTQAFSVGYRDAPFYDETAYASLAAQKFKLNHTIFSLSDEDLSEHVAEVLDYLDEPFGDASAIPTYILSKETKKHVTVALSGDGGDELFAGYYRHMAEYKARHPDFRVSTALALKRLWKTLPESRDTFLSNKVRQLRRFSETATRSPKERYLRWAMVSAEEDVDLFSEQFRKNLFSEEIKRRDEDFTKYIQGTRDLDDVLFSDVRHLLPDNMLHKVDMMSMANGLEVRVPFLDYRVVNFAFSLPGRFKTDGRINKKIVQDAFRGILPPELYNRPKKGFGVPLMKLYKTSLRSYLEEVVLADDFIREQGIFNPAYIFELKKRLFSEHPGDLQARIWTLIVFQHWWKKYVMS